MAHRAIAAPADMQGQPAARPAPSGLSTAFSPSPRDRARTAAVSLERTPRPKSDKTPAYSASAHPRASSRAGHLLRTDNRSVKGHSLAPSPDRDQTRAPIPVVL